MQKKIVPFHNFFVKRVKILCDKIENYLKMIKILNKNKN